MFPALFVLLLVALGTFQTGSANTVHTSGTSGSECGKGGRCRSFPYSSTCDVATNKCKCDPPYPEGKGNFMCHRQEEEFCAIFNDPEVCRYDGSRYEVRGMTCKFLLTVIKTDICVGDWHSTYVAQPGVGTCEVEIFAWGTDIPERGKTYIGGVQANVKLVVNGVTHFQNYRVYGTADNGFYTYVREGNKNPGGAGSWNPSDSSFFIPDLDGIYGTFLDPYNNNANIYADLCGVKVGFRAVDKSDPRDQPPGAYVKVHRGCNPEFLDLPGKEELCGFPDGSGRINDVVEALESQTGKRVSEEVAAMYTILTSGVRQDFPDAPESLQAALDAAARCDTTKLVCGIKQCLALMSRGFQRCYQNHVGTSSVSVFTDCLHAYCSMLVVDCERVQATIAESQCEGSLEGPSIWDENCSRSPSFGISPE